MKGSIIIVSFFILGVLLGYMGLVPDSLIESDLSFYVLCALMFFVGLSVGCDTKTLKSFSKLNPKYFLLPIATIVGTLGGCVIISFLLPDRQLSDLLAVGSGFGYYSLSSIFITEYRGAELGTIALLSNIMRELIALLLAPFLVRYFGKLSTISVGGATTMDTTLPVILKFSGKEFIVISVFHGFILDLSVPFLVTFFCSF
ncbi:MAG TPA: lysine exporter LysO family protein [Fermentimonas caenicola]|jgi:uncharacterized membrane protein YbjE (DUF340 family)|uniref:lysine exporter LysO family protein n=1 Tax=Lascolabacillus sp. TaxID=1924068 RepID=UPI000A88B890|nr:lysine exporter LysO family protein [Lascolabacillus sp.]MBP6175684.1 lysine exporter LysO family protein [Fermentimonas sp.]MDI9626499.1 lysine exporter LysO family protein [Bacteroidota bacterium]TAH60969.1 MAG: lysine exporter LysO family protein [Fermentimonas caenicola]MBP6197430.1 lysine exporter LysO family protein [Fermentimonas sp.]MBP7104906.1 lysine exporter LysO family protein [Fermentimonas sp.]